MVFTGTAKVSWRDTSTHHHDHPLFFHDFNFLNPSSHTAPHQGKKEHHQVHTLKPGRHVFPFSLHVPGSLPASLRTYSGSGIIEYKLKARAERPGITAADWKARRVVRIARGFGVDAVEYNQTLEIGKLHLVALSAHGKANSKLEIRREHLARKSHVLFHAPSQSFRRRRYDSSRSQVLSTSEGSQDRIPRNHYSRTHVSSS